MRVVGAVDHDAVVGQGPAVVAAAEAAGPGAVVVELDQAVVEPEAMRELAGALATFGERVHLVARIAVAAQKTAPARRGTVLDIAGTMWTVEWDDGRRSTFVPAPGSVTIEGAAHGSGTA